MMNRNNRIAIDFLYIANSEIANGRFTFSVAIFLSEILDGISELHMEDNFVILTTAPAVDMVRKRFPRFEVIGIGGIVSKFMYRFFDKTGQYTFKKYGFFDLILKFHGISKLWMPFLVPELSRDVKTPFIGTCHDLFFQEVYSDDIILDMLLKSKYIVTISENVRQQIIDQYGISDDKIETIPNAISIRDNAPQEIISELSGKKFILDINAYAERKNTLQLIKAFRLIIDKTDCDMVLCGGWMSPGYYRQCIDYVKDNGLDQRVHFYLGLPDTQINWLFNNCTLFVSPSEKEGFGRTPVEAGICRKPVICSRATSLEEATCGLLHYLDNPRNEQEIASLIIDVLDHSDSEEKLNSIRDTYISKYSVKAVAEQYIQYFRSVGWIR